MKSARNTDFSNMGYRETVQFYMELRKVLYDEMKVVFPTLNCSPISYHRALQADSWSSSNAHAADRRKWKWADAYHYYTDKKRFKRFDISIENSGNLIGLSYGMPSQVKTKLKVNILEGTPHQAHKKNAKIFELISESAQIYADLLGADEVRIINPVNDDVANYYCSYGYEYIEPAGKRLPVYCSLKLKD